MPRSAREVVELYNYVVWNKRKLELAPELFAATVIRHEVGVAQNLTREQACKRIEDHWAMFENIEFKLPLLVAGDDGEHVAIVYDTALTMADGTSMHVGSMEIFRVVKGHIAEVWNCGHKEGVWA